MPVINLFMPVINLYQLLGCPYCAKVRDKLEEKELKYSTINVPRERKAPIRMDLFVNSGVPTLPIIKIDDIWIGDSENIIAYLDEKF